MMETELVKMSPKGQLVVPQEIREEEGFRPGDRFVPLPVKDGVLFKRVAIPDLKAEFKKIGSQVSEKFKKYGITQKDVNEAVAWARRRSS